MPPNRLQLTSFLWFVWPWLSHHWDDYRLWGAGGELWLVSSLDIKRHTWLAPIDPIWHVGIVIKFSEFVDVFFEVVDQRGGSVLDEKINEVQRLDRCWTTLSTFFQFLCLIFSQMKTIIRCWLSLSSCCVTNWRKHLRFNGGAEWKPASSRLILLQSTFHRVHLWWTCSSLLIPWVQETGSNFEFIHLCWLYN